MGLYANQMFAEFVGRVAEKIKEKQKVKRPISSGTSNEKGQKEEAKDKREGNNKPGQTGS